MNLMWLDDRELVLVGADSGPRAIATRSVGASFVSELAAAGKLNTRLADIAGMKDLGANLAIEMFEVANLLESVEHAHPEAERDAVIEVLAALIALIWCSIWLAGWIQWAAVWGQPIREMDPYGLLGNAVLIGGSTRWAHGKSRQILGRSL